MMSIEKGKISSYQLIILIFTSMSGSAVILYPGREAGTDTWLAYLAGFAAALLLAMLVIKLSREYPGKNLIEINDAVYGSIAGRIISLLYIWYFFHLGSIVVRDFADFLSATMLPFTPIPVFVFVSLVLVAYMIRSGIEVIGRCAAAIFPLIMLTLFFITATISNEIKFNSLLPIMDITARDFLRASFHTAIFPFGEIIVFLMVAAFLENQKKIASSLILGMVLAVLNMLALSLLTITVLNGLAGVFTYPIHVMIYRIDIGDIITRVDILGASAGLLLGIIKMAVMYYAAALGTAQVLNLRSYTPVVLPIGLLMFDLSILQFPNALDNFVFHSQTYSYYALFFQLFLPLLTLLVSQGRKKIKGAASHNT
ncbi:spore germination protein gerkb [hydrocarbon metagenome]|uniref:Spore germination protein gerkb n=1 Tax=hydrocarbon metagenome TaxID=938273 RepID=A0A0W8E7F9_9ZZZZ